LIIVILIRSLVYRYKRLMGIIRGKKKNSSRGKSLLLIY